MAKHSMAPSRHDAATAAAAAAEQVWTSDSQRLAEKCIIIIDCRSFVHPNSEANTYSMYLYNLLSSGLIQI
jgi:hypothetical protein